MKPIHTFEKSSVTFFEKSATSKSVPKIPCPKHSMSTRTSSFLIFKWSMNVTVKLSLTKSTFKILSVILSQNHFLKHSFIFNVSSISWLSTTKFGCKSSCSYFSSLHSTGTNVIFENLVWGWFEDIRFGVTKIFANYAIIIENIFDLMIKLN